MIRAKMMTIIYPRGVELKDGDFIIGRFQPCDSLHRKDGTEIRSFSVLGDCVPNRPDAVYDLYGHWEATKKNKEGFQYRCENYKEVIEMSEEGIIGYLSSGLIKGIGEKTAKRIYEMFGVETIAVLDKNPEALLQVKGIGEKSLNKIIESYIKSRGARNVIAFLAPYGVTAHFSVKLYKEYGSDVIEIIRNNPYFICNIKGIGFKTADKLALNLGVLPYDERRIKCAILYALRTGEQEGNMCLPVKKLVKETDKVLSDAVPEDEVIKQMIDDMTNEGNIVDIHGLKYRARSAAAEKTIAESIRHLVKNGKDGLPGNACASFEYELREAERKIGMVFDQSQRRAIELALTKNISIITGGPGTGKTSIQKAILYIYKNLCPHGGIVCCAPTGRAARRMEEANGYKACTIHHLLQIQAGDGEESLISDGRNLIREDADSNTKIDGDLIIVDECSMIDSYIFEKLLSATSYKSRLVLIGDADQLPSVGPGAVFHELIESGEISVVRLNTVHRQDEGSLIAMNAKKIKEADTQLDIGDDFRVIEVNSMDEAADICEKEYIKAVNQYGIDEVAFLTPFRQRTVTGSNEMNERLRDIINPPEFRKPEIEFRNSIFRLGDKVMHLKNWANNPENKYISNGDIGYIERIYIDDEDDEQYAVVDFMDGRTVTYNEDDLEMLTWGYAMSIHKSQGSEYKCVIMTLQMAHYIMLNRPLIYTAVTRAKNKLIIIGEKKAIAMAIKTNEAKKRYTCLSMLIQEACS